MKQSLTSVTRLITALSIAMLVALTAKASEPPPSVAKSFYSAFISARDLQDLEKFESQRYKQERQKEVQKASFPITAYMRLLKMSRPKQVEVTGQQIEENKAKVSLKASTDKPIETSPPQSDPSVHLEMDKFGCIFLIKENDQWKVDGESWASQLSEVESVNPIDWQAWANEAAKIPAKQGSLQCKLNGKSFVPDRCLIGAQEPFGGTWLSFVRGGSKGFPDQGISINLQNKPVAVEQKAFTIADKKMSWSKDGMFNIVLFSKEYPAGSKTVAGVAACGMKIQFDQAQNGCVPGHIVLRLTSQPETSISGDFVAKISTAQK
jgi:hypothetical protein